jgi:ferric iron reductase protein FhuF
MINSSVDSPLQHTCGRAGKLTEHLRIALGAPQGHGWHAPSDLFAPDSPDFEAQIAAMQARLHTKAANVVGSALLQGYQWPVIAALVACYLLDRRVPDLRQENVRVHLDAEGAGDRIAFLTGSFTALPADAAATHPDARIVPDLAMLRMAARCGIEDHLGAIIERICARLGCKPRGLWLNVADSLAGTLAWLMQASDDTAGITEIAREVDALVRVPGSPLHSRQLSLFMLHRNEQRQTFLVRATCCYWYKTEGGEYCSTCPHRTPESRAERLLAYMAAQDVG